MIQFTVLIAVYNAEKYLEECLQSLQNQTLTNWEAICIDDGSTDTSPDILRAYQQQDKRFVLLKTEKNSGQAVARNLGLKQANGTFTLMLDADDYLAHDALELVWKKHEEQPLADAILFNLRKIWDQGKTEDWKWPHQSLDFSGKEACLLSIDWQIHGTYALRTSLHKTYPYDDTLRVYSDDTTVRIHYLKSKRVIVSQGIYFYRQHEDSCTHKFSLRRLDFLAANRILYQALQREGMDDNALTICESMAWKVYVGIFREFRAQGKLLSTTDRKKAVLILKQQFKEMRPDHISYTLRKSPSYFFIKPFFLFSIWQNLLLFLKKMRPTPHL